MGVYQLHKPKGCKRTRLKSGKKGFVINVKEGTERNFLSVVHQDIDAAKSQYAFIDDA